MRGLESTSLYFRGVAARPGGRIDPLIRRAHGGARGLPAPRDSGRGASDRWRAVTVCEPAHAMLNIAVWRGDATPPFEPPEARAAAERATRCVPSQPIRRRRADARPPDQRLTPAPGRRPEPLARHLWRKLGDAALALSTRIQARIQAVVALDLESSRPLVRADEMALRTVPSLG